LARYMDAQFSHRAFRVGSHYVALTSTFSAFAIVFRLMMNSCAAEAVDDDCAQRKRHQQAQYDEFHSGHNGYWLSCPSPCQDTLRCRVQRRTRRCFSACI
jgi:hypothetical protein